MEDQSLELLLGYFPPGKGGTTEITAPDLLVVTALFVVPVVALLYFTGAIRRDGLTDRLLRAAVGFPLAVLVMGLPLGVVVLLIHLHSPVGWILAAVLAASVLYARFWITTPRPWPA